MRLIVSSYFRGGWEPLGEYHTLTIISGFHCLVSYDFADFSFVRRIGNVVVDSLAKLSLSIDFRVWIEEVPNGSFL